MSFVTLSVCAYFSSNQFRAQSWCFFQISFSRICSDYRSAGLSSVTKTNQHGARQHQIIIIINKSREREREQITPTGQQLWKHVALHKEVRRVCGLGSPLAGRQTTTIADPDCSFFRKKTIHWTRSPQNIVNGGWGRNEMKKDTQRLWLRFFLLLWPLALSWLPYTSKGPAAWEYHEVAQLVPESHKNKIDNATLSG